MICDRCGESKDYSMALVEDDVWEAIEGGREEWCLMCMDQICSALNPALLAEVGITFEGMALTASADIVTVMQGELFEILLLVEAILADGPAGDRRKIFFERAKNHPHIPDWFIKTWFPGTRSQT